ncbi:MAG: putative TIM-barrel fold metal-dependent hydrolase [Acidimicrobiales bacterium]|jgi:predicted TIM-barrel fold metal-dependent hydrolase
MRVADVWANHWMPEFFERYPPMQELYDRVGIADRSRLPAGALVSEAASAGVERAIVSGSAIGDAEATNREVAELCAADPVRLVPCASVDPRQGMRAVRELHRCVTEDGFVALKLMPFFFDLPPNDRSYYPLYAACVELGIPVLVLTGHTAVLAPNETGRPQHLDDVALFFPELTIVAGHAGYPWTDELIGLAWKHERLFIDTSGHRPKHFPPQLVKFMSSYGKEKVLFGTGWPMLDPAVLLGDVEGLGLGDEATERFLWSNAASIWGWS